MSMLARYRIEGELGRGAMGVVYDAWDLTLDRRIALKEPVLPSGLGDLTGLDDDGSPLVVISGRLECI